MAKHEYRKKKNFHKKKKKTKRKVNLIKLFLFNSLKIIQKCLHCKILLKKKIKKNLNKQ